jgi:UDP-2,4-diacetamido-2,4,6-trideoxy-beta-L-altropyranose hydrolase
LLLRVYLFEKLLRAEMRVVFRTDASLQIGTGHVMRCLTLADALRERGAQCSFICRPHEGHLLQLIAKRGHQSLALPVLQEAASSSRNVTAYADWLATDWFSDAVDTKQVLNVNMVSETLEWLVVDHYALDRRWEQALRSNARRIMVIDDLADRPHDCDLLLDQNLGRTEKDYVGLLTPNTVTLIGPKYALLRPEFAALRPQSLARRENNSQLRRLLISMGGVDKDNATGQVLDALKACALPTDLQIIIVMGRHAPWLAQIQAQSAHMPWPTQVLAGVCNMAQLMADSDLAIGAAGGTAWERCCLGLPSLVLTLAENQSAGAVALQNTGAAIALETCQQIRVTLDSWQLPHQTDATLRKLSHAAAAVVDGNGCARAVNCMMEGSHA